MSDWTTVARAGELAPGSHRVVDVDGAAVVVFNLGGQYYAIEDVCTHDGG
ncbi:MAG: Rieske 2Fe-2S domain-containing protein, partial [Candidatus Rokuibacteriota bacterium]